MSRLEREGGREGGRRKGGREGVRQQSYIAREHHSQDMCSYSNVLSVIY